MISDLEHAWVRTVDKDYARHCGAESWIDRKDVGDSEISDFIYEKDLSVEVAQQMTGAFECMEMVAELLEIIRNADMRTKRELEKAEYKIAEEHYQAFEEYMNGKEKGAREA